MLQWVSKSAKGTDRLAGFENGSQELRAQSTLVHKQSDNAMEERLKQMEDTIQKEAAKISQERANLKVQQEDLVGKFPNQGQGQFLRLLITPKKLVILGPSRSLTMCFCSIPPHVHIMKITEPRFRGAQL